MAKYKHVVFSVGENDDDKAVGRLLIDDKCVVDGMALWQLIRLATDLHEAIERIANTEFLDRKP